MSVRKELSWGMVLVWWFSILGFIAPAMISARSTELALGGAFLLLGSAYGTYRMVMKSINKEAPNGHR